MKPKHYDFDFSKNGNNSFQDCKLGREKYAEILTDILNLYSEGFVLAINNKWGTGKTTFIKMWENYLKNKSFKTLYFNAWENDFENDVLVALLAELEILRDTNLESNFKNILKKATPLLKKSSLGLIKGLSKKVGADELVQAIVEGVSEGTIEGLENKIESYTNRKKGIQDFRKTLETYVELLGGGKPIIFIIDELDRCRPSYAVEVLEQVKHLFSVSGIVFVLAIDKEQLGHAVRGVYGSENINADEYLRRFIDIEYSIPEPNIKNYCDYLYSYFDYQSFFEIKERISYPELKDDKYGFLFYSNLLFTNSKISLRQIEKIYSLCRIALKLFPLNNYVYPSLFILLNYLKICNSKLFYEIKEKKISIQELLNKIENLFPNTIPKDNEQNSIIFTNAILLILYKNYLNVDVYQNKIELVNKNEKGENEFNFNSKYENKELIRGIEYFNRSHHISININLGYLFNKIDLLEPIIT